MGSHELPQALQPGLRCPAKRSGSVFPTRSNGGWSSEEPGRAAWWLGARRRRARRRMACRCRPGARGSWAPGPWSTRDIRDTRDSQGRHAPRPNLNNSIAKLVIELLSFELGDSVAIIWRGKFYITSGCNCCDFRYVHSAGRGVLGTKTLWQSPLRSSEA